MVSTESRELSAAECRTLLQDGVAGRVAFSTATGPQIVPVNYTVLEDSIIIRTSPYSLLGTYARDATIAFEIDGFDRELARGWSVQVRGRLEDVTTAEELRTIKELAEPQPWAPGIRTLHLRLRYDQLTGRQVGSRQESPSRSTS